MRDLEWTRGSAKNLRQIDKKMQRRIVDDVEDWVMSGPTGHKQLEDTKGLYSYRVGGYRAIYELQPAMILVVAVLKRGESYKRQLIQRSRD